MAKGSTGQVWRVRTRNTTSRVKQAMLNELLFLPPHSSLGIGANHLLDRNAFEGEGGGGHTLHTNALASFPSSSRACVVGKKQNVYTKVQDTSARGHIPLPFF